MPRRNDPNRASAADHPPLLAHRQLQWITIGLLLLVPVLFVRTLPDAFEFPKLEFLTTGAIFIATLGAAREAARAAAVGPAGWLAALPQRLVSWVRRDPLGACVLAYLASATLSTVFSIRPALSLLGAPESLAGLQTALATASLFFASRSLASDDRWFHRMTILASSAAAIAAGYALLQLLKLDPLPWGGYATFGGENRIFGTLAHPNMLGAYLVVSLPLIARVAMRAKNRTARIGWALVGALAFATVIATLSRGAWIALAMAAAAYLVLVTRRSRGAIASSVSDGQARAHVSGLLWAILLTAVVTGALLISAPGVRSALRQRAEQVADLTAPTTRSRLQLWDAGLRMGKDHPVLGIGLDGYGSAFHAYRSPEYVRIEWGGNPTKAHNEMINIFATQGSLGVATALAVVFLIAGAVWRASGSEIPATRADAVATGAALAGFAGQALTGFTVVAVGALAAALAGWLDRIRSAETSLVGASPAPRPGPRPGRMASLVILATGGALFVGLVVMPWLAARTAYAASRIQFGDPYRAEGYQQAAALLPWYDRYEMDAGLASFIEAQHVSDAGQAWEALEQGRRSFERAIRLDGGSGVYRAYLGAILSSEALLRPASAQRTRVRTTAVDAVTRDPCNPYVLVLAEEALLAAEFEVEAHGLALRCVNLYPDFAPPFADIGSLALGQGRYQDAADTLAIAVRKDWRGDTQGQERAWDRLSTSYRELGKDVEARMATERAAAEKAAR